MGSIVVKTVIDISDEQEKKLRNPLDRSGDYNGNVNFTIDEPEIGKDFKFILRGFLTPIWSITLLDGDRIFLEVDMGKNVKGAKMLILCFFMQSFLEGLEENAYNAWFAAPEITHDMAAELIQLLSQ